ncbi:MAG: substrate-binding periplasmic protein [Actinomycetota bacterium]
MLERTRIMVCAVTAMLSLGACVPAQTESDLSREFNEDTTMGEIQAAGVLRVGIPTESAPFATGGERDPRGFAVDLAELISNTMGVEADMTVGPSEQLLAQLGQEELDIAFSLLPVTEEGYREAPHADPFYLGHQRLLAPRAAGISSTDDLAGARVCSYTEETGLDIGGLLERVRAIEAANPDECVRALDTREAEAATAPDVLLMDMMAKLERTSRVRYAITGDQLTTEGYGIAMAPGAGAFVEYLNSVLEEAEESGDWAASYRRWLAPYSGTPARPPESTAEEAAALYPSEA